ncbi:MAG: AarF/UbiB family protein [Candidatus Paracaedibacteraceae bacterium]|nr:AarF/UbiB family protein [Candidatus Paracaedibacteraceae bacterium]
MDDTSPMVTKIKRMATVSSTVGGFAARLIGERVTNYNIDDATYAKTLKIALGQMKGPFMKVAQFLATIPDAIPPEYAKELLELQSNAPPMGTFFVKRRMQAELGENWEAKFQFFDQIPAAAASLGQVHKATHIDGTKLALKLQYPSMQSVVEADLVQLSFLFKTYHLFNKALNLNEVMDEIRCRLFEELDYVNEARNITDYQNFFKESKDPIKIPEFFSDLSTPRLLAMSWMEGISILKAAETYSQSDRDILGRTLFCTWYRPFYVNGWIHGDPHPGNYKVDAEQNLLLLDFGCVRRFDNGFVDGVIELYEALKHKKRDAMVAAYEGWGFTNLSNELIDVMNEWARLLYNPLLDDCVRPIQAEYSGAKGWETAAAVHKKLHSLGGLKVPKEFVFMDRASVGVGAVLMRLGAKQNWHQLFEAIIDERRNIKGKKYDFIA